ncbi:MAG: FKBP-type peptidyl-prolyl cis-trans isomerase [Phycisphaeraceae bacterium]|nr:FKBP-type peptidyl-prolyl cis-trans isomerase [Phycisphaeraceae bacterium]
MTLDQQISYALGFATAMNLRQQGIELQSPDLFAAGFRQAFGQGEPQLSAQQMQQALAAFQQRMMDQQQAMMQKMQEQGQANEATGTAFLDENAKKEGVTTTDSGLQIKTLKEGDGPAPAADSVVTINYEGRLIDGTVFDSSFERGEPLIYDPTQFNVIPGWIEGLQLMKQGGEYEIYIPSDLAYGPQGNGPIPPSSTLIFKMQVVKVAAPAANAQPPASPAPAEEKPAKPE